MILKSLLLKICDCWILISVYLHTYIFLNNFYLYENPKNIDSINFSVDINLKIEFVKSRQIIILLNIIKLYRFFIYRKYFNCYLLS